MGKIFSYLKQLFKRRTVINLGKRKPGKFLPREIPDRLSHRFHDHNNDYRHVRNTTVRSRMRRKMRRATHQSMRAHS